MGTVRSLKWIGLASSNKAISLSMLVLLKFLWRIMLATCISMGEAAKSLVPILTVSSIGLGTQNKREGRRRKEA